METTRWYNVTSDKNDGVMNYKVKVKVKFTLEQTTKAQRESGSMDLLFL